MRNWNWEDVLDLAAAFDMAILNMFIKTTTGHIGKAPERATLLLYRRGNIREVEDSKVLLGECGAQHSPVVVKLAVRTQRSGIVGEEQKIRWWKFRDEVLRQDFKRKPLQRRENAVDVE